MARLIDAEALREWLIRAGRLLKTQDDRRSAAHAVGRIIEHLDRMPTVDAVPVVRCRDCRYYTDATFNLFTEHDIMLCAYTTDFHCYKEPDDYCSKGVRKRGDNP